MMYLDSVKDKQPDSSGQFPEFQHGHGHGHGKFIKATRKDQKTKPNTDTSVLQGTLPMTSMPVPERPSAATVVLVGPGGQSLPLWARALGGGGLAESNSLRLLS